MRMDELLVPDVAMNVDENTILHQKENVFPDLLQNNCDPLALNEKEADCTSVNNLEDDAPTLDALVEATAELNHLKETSQIVNDLGETPEVNNDLKDTPEVNNDLEDASEVFNSLDDASEVIKDLDNTPEVIENLGNTSEVIKDLEDAPEVIKNLEDSPEVIKDLDYAPEVINDLEDTPEVVKDLEDTPEVVKDLEDTPEVVKDSEDTPKAVTDFEDTPEAVNDLGDGTEIDKDLKETSEVVNDSKDTLAVGDVEKSPLSSPDIVNNPEVISDEVNSLDVLPEALKNLEEAAATIDRIEEPSCAIVEESNENNEKLNEPILVDEEDKNKTSEKETILVDEESKNQTDKKETVSVDAAEENKTNDNTSNKETILVDEDEENKKSDLETNSTAVEDEQMETDSCVEVNHNLEDPLNIQSTSSDPLKEIDGSGDVEMKEPNPPMPIALKRLDIDPQIPDEYSPEEILEYNKMFGPSHQSVEFLRIHCTACNDHIGSAPDMQHKRYIHPLLRVIICKKCFDFYGSGDFDKDVDGSELYCRWCGQGGQVLCCAHCAYVFCKKCIRNNLGKRKLSLIKEIDDWTCFVCRPEQITKSRIICKALYDYVQKKIESGDEEQMKIDHSMCCYNRVKPFITKHMPDINDEFDMPMKKKAKFEYHHNASPQKIWQSDVEDEVVCTPDLSMLMGVSNGDEDEEEEGPDVPMMEMPGMPDCTPVQDVSPPSNDEVKFISQTKVTRTAPVVPPPTNILAYKLSTPTTSKVVVNNNTTSIVPNLIQLQKPAITFINSNPEATGPVSSVNRINATIKTPPSSRLAPGLKYEWFDKAAQSTARINRNLSSRLCVLSKQQITVTTLEGLANVHNSLQEILSTSVNNLMQIRKNLKNDFIAGLKKLKFCKMNEVPAGEVSSVNLDDDDDVILVDNAATPKPPTPPDNSKAYIKVKPISELFDPKNQPLKQLLTPVPPLSLPIINGTSVSSQQNVNVSFQRNSSVGFFKTPAELKHFATTTKKTSPTTAKNILNIPTSPSAKTSPTAKTTPPARITTTIKIPSLKNAGITKNYSIVKKDSKLKTYGISESSLKACGLTEESLEAMLKVRVILRQNFGNGTPKTHPMKSYTSFKLDKSKSEDVVNGKPLVVN